MHGLRTATRADWGTGSAGGWGCEDYMLRGGAEGPEFQSSFDAIQKIAVGLRPTPTGGAPASNTLAVPSDGLSVAEELQRVCEELLPTSAKLPSRVWHVLPSMLSELLSSWGGGPRGPGGASALGWPPCRLQPPSPPAAAQACCCCGGVVPSCASSSERGALQLAASGACAPGHQMDWRLNRTKTPHKKDQDSFRK